MFARVATFEGINVEAAQSSMDEAEAIIRPTLSALAGYEGALELATQDGKFLSITLFDSIENAVRGGVDVRRRAAGEARPHLPAVGGHPHVGRSLHGRRRRSRVGQVAAPGSVRRHGEELGRVPGRRRGTVRDRSGTPGVRLAAARVALALPARAHRAARGRSLRPGRRGLVGAARGGAPRRRRRRQGDRRARCAPRGPPGCRATSRRRSPRRSRRCSARRRAWRSTTRPSVILVVGVNGTGKTTTIGKLAQKLREHGRSVTVGAADTFRAAAEEQLEVWAKRAGAQFVGGERGADPGIGRLRRGRRRRRRGDRRHRRPAPHADEPDGRARRRCIA